MKKVTFILASMFLLLGASLASAAQIELWDWEFEIDGVVTSWSDTPDGMNDSGFDWSTGLGTLSQSFSGAGDHSFYSWFDHDIYDDNWDGAYDDESGAAVGTPEAGQYGALYDNQGSIDLDMGWDFTLADGEVGLVSLMISEQMPGGGFYLQQSDRNGADIFVTASLSVGPVGVPEPATFLLLGTGLLGLVGFARRRIR